jgi:hypothetical protein
MVHTQFHCTHTLLNVSDMDGAAANHAGVSKLFISPKQLNEPFRYAHLAQIHIERMERSSQKRGGGGRGGSVKDQRAKMVLPIRHKHDHHNKRWYRLVSLVDSISAIFDYSQSHQD